MKMPTRLQECKISLEDINKLKQEIAKGALEDACIITNPRTATAGDILEIIYKVS